MKVVFVMTGASATLGGIATHNRQVLQALQSLCAERNLSFEVLSFLETDTDRPPLLASATPFHGFEGDKGKFVRALLRGACSRPLLIFDHVTLALPVLPLLAAKLVSAVIFAHGSESWRRIRRSSRWLFHHATLVLTNSQFTLRKMREHSVSGNLVACPLGLAPEFESLHRPPPSDRGEPSPPMQLQPASGGERVLGERVCLLVGRMHPDEREKGHRELLGAWPQISREFPEAQLVFAGPGSDRVNLAQIACNLGVGDSVLLAGPTPSRTLQELYRRCYAFTMPSKQEGFGLAYLEAMSAAKPCLGCRHDGAEEVIVHQQTGLLIEDPKNPGAVLGALRELLGDPARARAMGQRGLQRLLSHYTTEHIQARLRQHLSGLL